MTEQTLVNIETLVGKRFDYGVCRSTESPHITTDWNPPFANVDVDFPEGLGWFNCRTSLELKQTLVRFCDARLNAKVSMSACAFIPENWASIRPLLPGWKRVLTLSKGAKVRVSANATSSETEILPSKVRIGVWYLPPKVNLSVGSKRKAEDLAPDGEVEEDNSEALNDPILSAARADGSLTMCFGAQIAGAAGHVLFDSAASENFVSESLCKLHGISVYENCRVCYVG